MKINEVLDAVNEKEKKYFNIINLRKTAYKQARKKNKGILKKTKKTQEEKEQELQIYNKLIITEKEFIEGFFTSLSDNTKGFIQEEDDETKNGIIRHINNYLAKLKVLKVALTTTTLENIEKTETEIEKATKEVENLRKQTENLLRIIKEEAKEIDILSKLKKNQTYELKGNYRILISDLSGKPKIIIQQELDLEKITRRTFLITATSALTLLYVIYVAEPLKIFGQLIDFFGGNIKKITEFLRGDRDKFLELAILKTAGLNDFDEILPDKLNNKLKNLLKEEPEIIWLLENTAIDYDHWHEELNNMITKDFSQIDTSTAKKINVKIKTYLTKLLTGKDVNSPEYKQDYENFKKEKELYSYSLRELQKQLEEVDVNDKEKTKQIAINFLFFYDLKKQLYESKKENGVGAVLNQRIIELEQQLKQRYGEDYDNFAKKWEIRNDNKTFELLLPIVGGVLIVGFLHLTVVKKTAKIAGKTTKVFYTRRAFLKKLIGR